MFPVSAWARAGAGLPFYLPVLSEPARSAGGLGARWTCICAGTPVGGLWGAARRPVQTWVLPVGIKLQLRASVKAVEGSFPRHALCLG